MKCFFGILCFLVFFHIDFFGQVSKKQDPASLTVKYLSDPPYNKLNRNDQKEIDKQDKYPLFAGYTISIDTKDIKGEWFMSPGGVSIWRAGFIVDAAKAMNLYITDLSLGPEEYLYVYDQNQTYLLGAFTNENNDRFFSTALVPGDSIIIEFNTSKHVKSLPFVPDQVGVAVNTIHEIQKDFGDSGPCEVLVNCPEGNDFQDEKGGVARILVRDGSSLFWCSGSLVNNTNRDGTPYFLTAHHCGENASASDYSQWVFYFGFESNDCEMPAIEPEHKSLSGAILIADGRKTSSGSDFKLLLLEEEIPSDYNPYFNGWSRSVIASMNGVGIHHPDGDLKMISTYNGPLISTNYNNPTPVSDGMFWHVIWSETQSGHGVTEGGSSGSPIFNADGYIVGTLSGGRASCSNLTKPDYYGKFSSHWEDNGNDSTEQLKPWLDPIGSDVPALRGLDLDSTSIKADFDSDKNVIAVGGGIQFNDKSQGEITSYRWEFPGGDPTVAESSVPPIIFYKQAGDYDVKLVVESEDDIDSLIIMNYVQVLPNIYPNPTSDGLINITFGDSIPDDLDIKIFNISGQALHFVYKQVNENAIVIDLREHEQGYYFIKVTSDGKTQLIKAVR